jgi:hypothetical protein
MPKALVATAIGTVDGVNRDFQTGAPYLLGSTVVFLNGMALRRDWDNGWVELGSDKIRMNEAPITGDALQIYFRPL